MDYLEYGMHYYADDELRDVYIMHLIICLLLFAKKNDTWNGFSLNCHEVYT
jgi:hypothetical protein